MIYKEIKSRLTMRQVAERYGLKVVRNTCLCPFHHEDTPSLHLYKDSFYCFGCGAGGDVITFVAKLCGLHNREAAARLNADFALGLNLDAKPSYRAIKEYEKQQSEQKHKEQWLQEAFLTLSAYRRKLWRALKGEAETPLWFEALEHLETLDYYLDELSRVPEEFYQQNRKDVEAIARRLHNITDRRYAPTG